MAPADELPPAEVPPASLEAAPLSLDSSLLASEVALDEPGVECSPLFALVAVDVVDVEVVSAAARSAEVSFGGVISGVLLGVTSETLLLPHAPSPTAAKTIIALAPSAASRER